jgi:hypothetical protein
MLMIFDTNGSVSCLYSDILELDQIGRLTISRGSHVEPTLDGQWTADMSPVCGPVLGPYRSRKEALAAEVDWLEANWLASLSR